MEQRNAFFGTTPYLGAKNSYKSKLEGIKKMEEIRKFYESILEWEWFSDPSTTHLFIYLIHAVKEGANNYSYRELKIIERGKIKTSLSRITKETGLSISQIRTSLRKLKSTGFIEVQSTNKYSIIEVINPDEFPKILFPITPFNRF